MIGTLGFVSAAWKATIEWFGRWTETDVRNLFIALAAVVFALALGAVIPAFRHVLTWPFRFMGRKIKGAWNRRRVEKLVAEKGEAWLNAQRGTPEFGARVGEVILNTQASDVRAALIEEFLGSLGGRMFAALYRAAEPRRIFTSQTFGGRSIKAGDWSVSSATDGSRAVEDAELAADAFEQSGWIQRVHMGGLRGDEKAWGITPSGIRAARHIVPPSDAPAPVAPLAKKFNLSLEQNRILRMIEAAPNRIATESPPPPVGPARGYRLPMIVEIGSRRLETQEEIEAYKALRSGGYLSKPNDSEVVSISKEGREALAELG
jgi:hypothetical protein